MESTSQTSADDIINRFDRSCSCSTLSDTTFGGSIVCSAKEMVDKLMVELKEKDEKYKDDIKKLLANLNLEKARAVEATAGTDKLKTELAIAHKTISTFQKIFWKSFPSPHLCYKIKASSGNRGGYLLYDYNGNPYLNSSTGDYTGHFKFEEDSDGNFSIYSKAKAKYLQVQTSCTSAASVDFCANADQKSKFALIFHPQQDKDKHQLGIFVDIFALANRCFLSLEVDPQIRLVANSSTAPAKKFLILAEDVA